MLLSVGSLTGRYFSLASYVKRRKRKSQQLVNDAVFSTPKCDIYSDVLYLGLLSTWAVRELLS